MSKTSKYNKDTPEDNINAHEGGDINLIFELFGKNWVQYEFFFNSPCTVNKNFCDMIRQKILPFYNDIENYSAFLFPYTYDY